MSISSHTNNNHTSRTAVLHLSADIESSDPGRETVDLAILTHRLGWKSVIASGGGKLVNEAERAAVRHKRVPLNRKGIFAYWRSKILLDAVLQSERSSLIHAHGIETIAHAVRMSRANGIPMVADFTQPLAVTPHNKKLMDSLKTTRSSVRVPSEYMVKHLRDEFGIADESICLIHPGIDLQCFSVGFISPERLQKISHHWRLPEQASIILAPMPLEPDMGHRKFLEILRQMRDENIYAVLVGGERTPSPLRAEIEALIEAHGLSGKVIMPDDCPDLPAACWLSSVVVAPNQLPRGQNLELLAAQAIGRPVIITDVGANPEMVHRGETAWVVKSGDMNAMVSALREAITMTSDQRLGLAERTHNFIAEYFPQNAWFDSMMILYESLLYPSRQINRLAPVAAVNVA